MVSVFVNISKKKRYIQHYFGCGESRAKHDASPWKSVCVFGIMMSVSHPSLVDFMPNELEPADSI